MDSQLIFYTNPMSRGRMSLRWMLEEVGVPYETRLLDYGTTMKGRDYLKVNPMGKVPALVHGETVITEASAICTYLADAFPEAGLSPALDSFERGAYYRWLFFAAGPLEAAIINNFLQVEISEEQRARVGFGSFDDVLDMVEAKVSKGNYLVGNRFSVADLYLGSNLDFSMQFKSIEERSAFRTYVDHLNERPARIRALQIDDALIAAQQ